MVNFRKALSSPLIPIFIGIATLILSLVTFDVFAQGQTVDYWVEVVTSDRSEAGTDGDVYITLHGVGGKFGPTELDASGDDFEKGDTQWYEISTPLQIGRLISVTMKLDEDGSNSDDAWALNSVRVATAPLTKENNNWPLVMSDEDLGFADDNNEPNKTFDVYNFKFNDHWFDKDEKETSMSRKVVRDNYDDTVALNVIKPTQGQWTTICSNSQNCAGQVVQSVSYGTNKTEVDSTAVTASVTATVSQETTAGAPTGGPQSKTTTSLSATLGSTITNTTSSSSSTNGTYTSSCNVSNTFNTGDTNNVVTVHQYSHTADLGWGPIEVKTCMLACTINSNEVAELQTLRPDDSNIPSCTRQFNND